MLKKVIDGETNLINEQVTETEEIQIDGETNLSKAEDGESGLIKQEDGDSDIPTNDHNKLINREMSNQHPIEAITGLLDKLASLEIKMMPCSYWDRQRLFIPKWGEIIVYSDYETTIRYGETVYVPKFKIGDGETYLIDLAYVGDDLKDKIEEHVANRVAHLTQEERNGWNRWAESIDSDIFTLLAHISDSDIHVTSNDKTAWNDAVGDISSHVGDSDIHVTASDKQAWNGKITAPSSATADQFLVFDGTTWVAKTVPNAQGVGF